VKRIHSAALRCSGNPCQPAAEKDLPGRATMIIVYVYVYAAPIRSNVQTRAPLPPGYLPSDVIAAQARSVTVRVGLRLIRPSMPNPRIRTGTRDSVGARTQRQRQSAVRGWQ
jgi:hypothetical protein